MFCSQSVATGSDWQWSMNNTIQLFAKTLDVVERAILGRVNSRHSELVGIGCGVEFSWPTWIVERGGKVGFREQIRTVFRLTTGTSSRGETREGNNTVIEFI